MSGGGGRGVVYSQKKIGGAQQPLSTPNSVQDNEAKSPPRLPQFFSTLQVRQDPLEAILVIFGRRALIFFV